MKVKTILISAAVVGTGVALYFLVMRKNTLTNTGASYVLPPAGSAGSPVSTSGNPTQAYTSAANVVLRTSACTNDPTLWVFGGNVGLTIPNAATWVGTILGTFPDTNGDVNPITGVPYNWYEISLSSTLAANFSSTAGSNLYIREDFCTLK